jgi:hypothetical protein
VNKTGAGIATGTGAAKEKFSIALSEQMLSRGRAVLLDGALPSRDDAFCMLAPPFGDGFGAAGRFIEIWSKQPLARSYDARQALDYVSVDEEDLGRLRHVLARDLMVAPETARTCIEEAVVQLDMALTWTGSARAASRLSGLAACHSRGHDDPAERLVAAASAVALAATGAGAHGFPASGLFPSHADHSGTDSVERIVAATKMIIRGLAGQRMKFATVAAAIPPADRTTALSGDVMAMLRSVPARLPTVDTGSGDAATFAALLCPAPAFKPSDEELRHDCRSWAMDVMTNDAPVVAAVDGLMTLFARMTVGEGLSVRGLSHVLAEVQSLELPEDTEDPAAARIGEIVEIVRLRLNLYMAHLGDPEAASKAASWSAGIALANLHRAGSWALVVAALAWAERSAVGHAVAPSTGPFPGLPDVDEVFRERFASRLCRTAAGLASALSTVPVARSGDADSFSELWRLTRAIDDGSRRSAVERWSAAGATAIEADSVVVVRSIAAARPDLRSGPHAEFLHMVGKPIPLVFTADVRAVYKKLTSRAPHARHVIDVMLRDTAASRTASWRPTILLGNPGSGKTLLAVDLCEAMQIPYRVFGCGGVADSSFSGTSRQWGTGRASVPLQTIRTFGQANVAIILDELDKVGGGGGPNGSLIDGLLSMTEKVSSRRMFDVYLEGEVDLHRVLWLATANDVRSLHPALLDRFRILHMPDARARDIHTLLPRVAADIAERRGLTAEWVAAFDPVEMDIIADLWPGGSLRRLSRIVEALMDARDQLERAN